MTDAAYTNPTHGGLIAECAGVFARQRAFAEHALAQLDDAGFFAALAPGLNPPAVIVRHVAGNLRSRFTDFLTTDGEKPGRDREAEFTLPTPSVADRPSARARVMAEWVHGWSILTGTLATLTEADADRTVTIRSVPHTVRLALLRQIDHYAFHTGQLNIIARAIVGTQHWKWFTIPPGGTAALNAALRHTPAPMDPTRVR
jgi:hypothetical protein